VAALLQKFNLCRAGVAECGGGETHPNRGEATVPLSRRDLHLTDVRRLWKVSQIRAVEAFRAETQESRLNENRFTVY
jgi:hypothetical protein